MPETANASTEAPGAIVVDQTEYRLSPEQWKAFCRRLDNPPKVVPALRQLFQESGAF